VIFPKQDLTEPAKRSLRTLMTRPGEPARQMVKTDGDAPEAGRRPRLWSRLRERLRNRPDTEHEQSLVRVAIGIAIVAGLAIAAAGDRPPAQVGPLLLIAASYLGAGALLLAHILVDPRRQPARRYFGMAVDMIALTMVLLIGQGTAAVFYPFYLWITLGMGFRYGRRYLVVSAVISLLSFALVITVTEYWRAQPALATGLWLALLFLPAYASSLLAKLTDAIARAEAASRAKSRFLATMSHELRTPLHAIIGMADLLRASPLRSEQQDMVRTLRSAGQSLLEMIGDLLDIAKIESGPMTVEPVPCSRPSARSCTTRPTPKGSSCIWSSIRRCRIGCTARRAPCSRFWSIWSPTRSSSPTSAAS
jgi:two-component system sensor histidine kinase RpfC